MLTFILSFIVTVIISFCFFKSKFWENRYLVLLIGTGVALIATLVLNYSVRGHLSTKTEITFVRPMKVFYIKDTLPENKIPFLKHWDYYSKHNAKEFYKDTTKKQRPVTVLFYTIKNTIYIGVFNKNMNQDFYVFDDVYLTESSADSVAFVSRKKLYYDVKPNNWMTGFSFPRLSKITILHIPPTEFALIPDSLIRKIPF